MIDLKTMKEIEILTDTEKMKDGKIWTGIGMVLNAGIEPEKMIETRAERDIEIIKTEKIKKAQEAETSPLLKSRRVP